MYRAQNDDYATAAGQRKFKSQGFRISVPQTKFLLLQNMSKIGNRKIPDFLLFIKLLERFEKIQNALFYALLRNFFKCVTQFVTQIL